MPVACFGKLPFHREFLRIGVDGPAAGWVVRWIEDAHAAFGRGGERAPARSPLVRFTAVAEGRWLAGVVRQSDDGLRRHPIALFADVGSAPAAERWPLVPIACVTVWTELCTILERRWDGPAPLGTALALAAPVADLDGAARAWAAALGARGGFAVLAGDRGDRARHLALNLRAVARAQAEARSASEGVAVAVPLAGPPGDGAAHAGLWVACLAAAAGVEAWPTLLVTDEPPRLVACWRPAEGRDLAAVLQTSLGTAPIDDLSEPWQTLPPADRALAAALDDLLAADDALDAVPARLRAFGRR